MYHNDKTQTSAVVDPNKPGFGLSSLNLTTPNEILNIINNLNTNTSSGVDHINAKMIKCIKHQIIGQLSACINHCLEEGNFPTNLKTAKVTPIYKSGIRSDPNNYRPISVLPVISKIFD